MDPYFEDVMKIIAEELPSATAGMIIGRWLHVIEERKEFAKKAADVEVKKLYAESDRDNRARRMQIAMAILDETQIHDLDKIASILWPEDRPKVILNAMYGKFASSTSCDGDHAAPVCADPECWQREFDEVSETQDGQSIYRRGSQVQTVPFPDMCKHYGCPNLADLTWKNGYCGQHLREGQPVATAPIDQPTQVPTEVEACGYKEQLGPRLWKCTRPKGHADHHHLDDGVEILNTGNYHQPSHTHKIQRDSMGKPLSSYCECGFDLHEQVRQELNPQGLG